MISEIFPNGHQRYTSLPLLGPIMEEFTVWSIRHGYTALTVRAKIKETRQIDAFFREQGIHRLYDLEHKDFDNAWVHYRHYRPNIAGTIRRIELFLEERSKLKPRQIPPRTPAETELDRFLWFLQHTRGLAVSTLSYYATSLLGFLEHIRFAEDDRVLARLSSKDVEDYICTCSERMNRYSLQHTIAHLRAFLKFQHERGVVEAPLHTMIDTPRVYRLEKLPRSLPWEMVEELLATIDRTSAHGIRDYTMLFLAASYGLRPCEIVSLTLDDICWRRGEIAIPQQKTGNLLVLPLSDLAGKVLIDYLKKGRPELLFREMFLRVRAPSGPLKPTAVTETFQLRVRRSGLDIPYRGPYCLRHSYAVHLIRRGTTLKAIGDLLGHRSAESTCAYLRLAIEDLRDVALPVPKAIRIYTPLEAPPPAKRLRPAKRVGHPSPPAGATDGTRSSLAGDIDDFLKLKRALGREFQGESRVLESLDCFLAGLYPQAEDLSGEMFQRWTETLSHLTPTVRRSRMRIARNLCLYRARSHPGCYVPDPLTFPANHQPVKPYIFSEGEISRLLGASQLLEPSVHCLLRAQTFRLAIILLYTAGLRRGELLRLKLGNFSATEGTLHIQSTKFHKSRLIPLSETAADELSAFLALRAKSRLPMGTESPLIWNGYGGGEGKAYSAPSLLGIWSILCRSSKILTDEGKTPRIHDLRHSFAVNALLRWYEAGGDVDVKLPFLSTYMGHVSIASTHYYLSFVEEIRSEASARFERSFGKVVTANCSRREGEIEMIGGGS
jgi:integrase